MRNNSRITAALGLVLWLAICFLVAAVSAAASLQAGTFYAELVRPDWAPPSAVFGPVWTTLYAMMAVAAWLVWRRRENRLARIGLVLFVVQLALNALWSWLFFGWSLGALSFLDIALLCVLILVTLTIFWRIRPLAGVLLVPYLAWVTFASALNYQIWQLNPSLLGAGEAKSHAPLFTAAHPKRWGASGKLEERAIEVRVEADGLDCFPYPASVAQFHPYRRSGSDTSVRMTAVAAS